MANALAHALHAEFGAAVAIQSAPYAGKAAGAFEVTMGGITLIHSALKLGHGRVESDEELDNIFAHIRRELGRRASFTASASPTRAQSHDGADHECHDGSGCDGGHNDA